CTPLSSPSTIFSIDDHADHAQIESGTRFPRVSRDTFSYPFFNNLRNLGNIWQCGIISLRLPLELTAGLCGVSSRPGWELRADKLFETVQCDVRQQRRRDATLRGSGRRF